MNRPLLTIAIPTWNRCLILEKALTTLLPQLEGNEEDIEIIISDNASTDDTNKIILDQISNFKTLNVNHFRQQINTGYFGNFQKCRQLSSGQYFWLLSDNDHVSQGLISYLLNVLKQETPSFIFLRDWVHANKVKKNIKFDRKVYSIDNALVKFNYKLTLISAVIFKNDKKNDLLLFNHFKGNTFIGFAYFLQSLKTNNRAIEIIGKSLFIHDSKVSFNAFKSFSVDLISCLEYAKKENILSEKIIHELVNTVISELTIKHYVLFRITGQLHGIKHEVCAVDELIINGFSKYKLFKDDLDPLIKSIGFNFYKLVLSKYVFKIIKQRILR